MKYEDSLFIYETTIYVSKRETIVTDTAISNSPKAYFGERRERRYVILAPTGIKSSAFYDNAIRNECYFAAGLLKTTRKYIRSLDSEYFKFYDDAEEVLKNIIIFLKWLRLIQAQMTEMTPGSKRFLKYKKAVSLNIELLRDLPLTESWEKAKASMIGKSVRKRSDLEGLKKFQQNNLDLVEDLREED